jgi:hypothetical protein
MFTTIYSKSRKLFPIALVAFAVAMLASCSSSNQFASSFSKRKYTPGHFSDPVAKVKQGNANTATAAIIVDNKVEANNTLLTKNEKATVKTNFSTPAKPANVKNDKPVATALKTLKQHVFGITKAPVNTSSNLSLQQTSTIQDTPAYGDHGGGGDRPHHHYLLDCLLCLLLWLVFIILAAASAVGGSGAGLGLFAILAYIAAIAALVFFILWIVEIAS